MIAEPERRSDGSIVEHDVILLGPDLLLPVSAVLGPTILCGLSGSATSWTARRYVDEAVRIGITVLVIDSVGHWRGISRSRQGEVGLQVMMAGPGPSEPLGLDEPHRIAQAVLQGIDVVANVSDLGGVESARIVAAILEEVYSSAGDRPLLVVIEDASELVPERAAGDAHAVSNGVIGRIARRGRARDLGLLAVTRELAAVDRAVLSHADLLIAFASASGPDRHAICEWVEAESRTSSEVLARQLQTLGVGEALVWRPVEDVVGVHLLSGPWTADGLDGPLRTPRSIDIEALAMRVADLILAQLAPTPGALPKDRAGPEPASPRRRDEAGARQVSVTRRPASPVAEAIIAAVSAGPVGIEVLLDGIPECSPDHLWGEVCDLARQEVLCIQDHTVALSRHRCVEAD